MADYALIDGYLDSLRTAVRWRRDLDDLVAELEDHLYSAGRAVRSSRHRVPACSTTAPWNASAIPTCWPLRSPPHLQGGVRSANHFLGWDLSLRSAIRSQSPLCQRLRTSCSTQAARESYSTSMPTSFAICLMMRPRTPFGRSSDQPS